MKRKVILLKIFSLVKYLFSSLLFVMLYACGPKTIFDQQKDIPNPWSYGDKISFEYEVQDTATAYDLLLGINHVTDFSFENLYMNVTTVFPDGQKITNPVSFQLADSQTDWIGDCNSNSCDIEIEMSTKAFYKKSGKYTLIFEQYSRKDSLEGINWLKVKIQEHEE